MVRASTRVRKRLRRFNPSSVITFPAGLAAGMAASPFVLLWHALGGMKRLDGRWIIRFVIFLILATSWVRWENTRGVASDSAAKGEAWLDRRMDSVHPVSGIGYDRYINEYSGRAGLDPRLVAAVIAVESSGNSGAVSPKGAMGLMQVMPGTWEEVTDAPATRVSMLDPARSIKVGTTYLGSLLKRCDGKVGKALIAYNAGFDRVGTYSKRIAAADFDSEPARYVLRVYGQWDRLCGRKSPPPPAFSLERELGLGVSRFLCSILWILGGCILGINCLRWVSGRRRMRNTVRW